MRVPLASLAILAVVFLGSTPVLGKKHRPTPCAGGTFVVEDATILAGDVGPSPRAIVIAGGHISLGGCAAVPVKLKASKKGTRLAVRWRSCPAYAGKLHLAGIIDPTCRTFTGTLRGRRPKLDRPIVAALDKLRGNLRLMVTINVPEDARAGVLAQRSLIEAQGEIIAADGSTLSRPPQEVGGWLVKVGDNRARTLLNGDFFIHVPPGGSADAQLFHPSDDRTSVYSFPASQLVPPDRTPVPIDLELRTNGPCGMNDASESSCHAAPQAADQVPAGPLALPLERASPLNDPTGPAFTIGDLGTYPAGNQTRCAQDDGLSTIGNALDNEYLSYAGSTCFKKIYQGCCGNERAELWTALKSKVFGFKPTSCFPNHKGRFCQEVLRGDIAIQTPDGILSASVNGSDGPPQQIAVSGGGTVDVTVHNNACYGDTHVEKLQNDLGGVLFGPFFDQATLQHYGPSTGGIVYVPDRKLTYRAPPCPQNPEAEDRYRFEADGFGVQLAIHVDCVTPTTTTTTTTTSTTTTSTTTTSTTTTSTTTTSTTTTTATTTTTTTSTTTTTRPKSENCCQCAPPGTCGSGPLIQPDSCSIICNPQSGTFVPNAVCATEGPNAGTCGSITTTTSSTSTTTTSVPATTSTTTTSTTSTVSLTTTTTSTTSTSAAATTSTSTTTSSSTSMQESTTTTTTTGTTTSTTIFPSCANAGGDCGSCGTGNGMCGDHCDASAPALVCINIGAGPGKSCTKDADCTEAMPMCASPVGCTTLKVCVAPCPTAISRRAFKRDIRYLTATDLRRLRTAVVRGDGARDGIDLYGYLSRTVAAIQAQESEITKLKSAVTTLRHDLGRHEDYRAGEGPVRGRLAEEPGQAPTR